MKGREGLREAVACDRQTQGELVPTAIAARVETDGAHSRLHRTERRPFPTAAHTRARLASPAPRALTGP